MKKIISVLLITLLLCGGVSVAASAAPALSLPKASALAIPKLEDLLKPFDLSNLSETQLKLLIGTLAALKKLGVDLAKYLEPVTKNLPIPVKAALHEAGLVEFPIWERSYVFNFIFKWLLFGWLWM